MITVPVIIIRLLSHLVCGMMQAQSDEDDLGGEDVAVSMEGSKLDEFFQEVSYMAKCFIEFIGTSLKVTWSRGHLGHMANGHSVPWSHGPRDHMSTWSHGHMCHIVTWPHCHGTHVATWSRGHMISLPHGHMVT